MGNIIQIKYAVKSYGPDSDFGYVYSVTLTLESLPGVKVITQCEYYPDSTSR